MEAGRSEPSSRDQRGGSLCGKLRGGADRVVGEQFQERLAGETARAHEGVSRAAHGRDLRGSARWGWLGQHAREKGVGVGFEDGKTGR